MIFIVHLTRLNNYSVCSYTQERLIRCSLTRNEKPHHFLDNLASMPVQYLFKFATDECINSIPTRDSMLYT